MANDESSYKREEDRRWRESVETRLVSLTTAQKQTDDDLDKFEGRIDANENLLEGDPLNKDDSGIKGDVRDLWKAYNELRAIIAPDHLGQGGVKNRLDALESELGIRRRWKLSRKAFAAAVGVAIVSTTAFFISNWDTVAKLSKQAVEHFQEQKAKPAGKRAGQKRSTGRRAATKPAPAMVAPAEAPDGQPAKEDLQQ